MRRIVCAAVRNISLSIMVLGPRHLDQTMRAQILQLKRPTDFYQGIEQGFIDNHGVFVDRSEAWLIAVEAGQVLNEVPGPPGRLFSEHLY